VRRLPIGWPGGTMYSSDLIDISSQRCVMEDSKKSVLIERLLPNRMMCSKMRCEREKATLFELTSAIVVGW
jgi:hypothetical protein